MGRPSSFVYSAFDVSPVPTCPATPISDMGSFQSAVRTVGDNGAYALERLPTVGMAVPWQITIRVPSADGTRLELQDWVLDVSRDPTDALHQRPNDYADPANVRCWTRYR